MLVKMLKTTKGTLNNGLGNITMIYEQGQIYDAPNEEATIWIDEGIALDATKILEAKRKAKHENKMIKAELNKFNLLGKGNKDDTE